VLAFQHVGDFGKRAGALADDVRRAAVRGVLVQDRDVAMRKRGEAIVREIVGGLRDFDVERDLRRQAGAVDLS
jgi:hypothetical protein